MASLGFSAASNLISRASPGISSSFETEPLRCLLSSSALTGVCSGLIRDLTNTPKAPELLEYVKSNPLNWPITTPPCFPSPTSTVAL